MTTSGDDPYERAAQTFPRLSVDQVERLSAFGTPETIASGTLVLERGQRRADFLVVLSGAIEIFDCNERGDRVVLVTHGPNQFTGELDLFNGREVLVNGRARGETRVLRIKRPDFQRMITAEGDIGEVVMRAFILRRVGLIRHGHAGVVVLGSGHSAEAQRIQTFLSRNGYPYRMVDVDQEGEAQTFYSSFSLAPADLPVVLDPRHRIFKNPSNADLADALGLTESFDPAHVYDVIVVGAGPAGLAAAVYAASEGLDTLVIEGIAPGGQAGTSSKIENYLGFPTGISGQALAGRAQVQAQKFGARLAISRHVVGVSCDEWPYTVKLEDDRRVRTRSIVIATGARYRGLGIAGCERYEGQGIHYAATAMEAELCAGEEVVVVGGGNSAGQAALFLSRTVKRLHMVVRRDSLSSTMSSYLVDRIVASARITLCTSTLVTALGGERNLESVTLRNAAGVEETYAIGNLFAMIGAVPRTEWIGECLALDAKGFVATGRAADGTALSSPYATTLPGVFAVGDVRSGSVKRVASSVGEGSVVVHAIHAFLAERSGEHPASISHPPVP